MPAFVLTLSQEPGIDDFYQEYWVVSTDARIPDSTTLSRITGRIPAPDRDDPAQVASLEATLLATPGILSLQKGLELVCLQV